MVGKADQARVKDLITETITLLCKNGLHFRSEFSIQALIGVTLDKNEIFLVNIDKTIVLSEDPKTANDKEDCLVVGIDREDEEEDRCSSITEFKNHKQYGKHFQRQRTDPTWIDNIVHSGSEFNTKVTSVDVRETLQNESPPFHKTKQPPRKRKQCPNGTASLKTDADGLEYQSGSSSNLDLTQNLVGNFVPDVQVIENNTAGRKQVYGDDSCVEVKQEPKVDENDAFNFQAYQDQLLSSYNIPNRLQSQLLQPHAMPELIDASLQTYHHQQVMQELIDSNASSNLHVRDGQVRPGARGGLLPYRRRSLTGPVYRVPRNVICNVCGKAFEKKRDLRGHQAAKHQMQKEHKCDICGKEFSYKRSLTDHMFIHMRPLVLPSSTLPGS